MWTCDTVLERSVHFIFIYLRRGGVPPPEVSFLGCTYVAFDVPMFAAYNLAA